MEYKDITEKIIGCAMKVHSDLGNGFQEVIYQRALAIEMNFSALSFEREKEMKIFYRNFDIGTRRADFFIEDKIMVEIKAVVLLEDVHLAQAINYLEAYNMKMGLLINFGGRSLVWKRLYNNSLVRINKILKFFFSLRYCSPNKRGFKNPNQSNPLILQSRSITSHPLSQSSSH